MLATTALLGLLSFWQTPEVACVAQGGTFPYPPLAKAARIYSNIVVHVRIGADGVPTVESFEGHPLFSDTVAASVSTLMFPPSCAGQERDLRLNYRLIEPGEAQEGSTATARNECLISGFALHTVDMPAVLGRKPWWKRIFGR